MASTTFVPYNTPAIGAVWLNEINDAVFEAIGDGVAAPTTPAQVLANIGGVSLAQLANPALGDGLLGVQRSDVGSIATTQHVVNEQRDVLPVADFGAVGNGVTDDSAAIAAALATGKVINLGGKTYRIATKLVASTAGALLMNGTLLFDGANTTRLLDVTAANVTFFNVGFEGNNKQPRGSLVYVDANVARPRFLHSKFSNLLGTAYGSNVLNQMCALNINPYGVTDFEIDGCEFSNIKKYNDGSLIAPAAGLGFAGGVYFLVEAMTEPVGTQTVITRGNISNSVFNTIQTILAGGLTDNQVNTYDDGDAIRTLGGATGDAPSLNVHVSDCTFIACSKRAIKFRASGSVATDCEIYTAGNAYGMSAPVDVVYDCVVDNVRVYASAALPCISAAIVGHGGVASNNLTQLSNFYCSHNKAGVQLLGVAGVPFQNVTLDGIVLPNASINGIQQSNATPCTTQKNLIVRNVKVTGSGNNCQGLALSQAADNTGGWVVDNVVLENADWKIEGINNDLGRITTTITSSAFAGSSTTRALAEYGLGKGFGGFLRANKIVFNLQGINTAYLSASRPYLILFYADKMDASEVSITVPEGMDTTFPHYEGLGDDFTLDRFRYSGPGYCRQGHLVASNGWSVNNAKRMGRGTTTLPFWTLSATSDIYEFNDIVDFRDTNQPTIVSSLATNGIASNIRTRSTNASPFQTGVATTGGVLAQF